MGLTFSDFEVKLGEQVLTGAPEAAIQISSEGSGPYRTAPLPTGRVESFTVILNDARAETIRKIGVGGVCQLSGSADGNPVRQSARIEAIEPTPEGGLKAHFVWAPDAVLAEPATA